MFLKNFHIFIKKRAVLQQKFTVQVTTLADCDDITRFDGTFLSATLNKKHLFKKQLQYLD
jgi:hypothetical protein